jgi:uncharacterized protein (TIGR03086 family)
MDVRALDRRALDATGSIIAGLTDDQLDAATPCTEWTVRDVIEHMVGNAIHYTAAITGSAAPAIDGDVRERFRTTGERLTAAFASDTALELPIRLGKFGTFNGKIALGIHFVDVLVHGWDLGKAIGKPVDLDEELAIPALKIAEFIPDTPQVRGPGGAFAPRRPVADEAPAGIRLVAVSGRSPSWPG